MDTQPETVVAPSFTKALILSAFEIVVFVLLCNYALRIASMGDPLFIIFFLFTAVVMTPIFAVFICFLIRCRIDHDGVWLESFVLLKKGVFWNDVTSVNNRLGLFHVVYGKGLGDFCIMPGPLLAKNPEYLKQLIRQYAPADNLVRRKLAP